MITQINNIAEVWWTWMWPMFWQVSILVVFLGAVDLLLRRHVWPQVRYALWLLVLIKLILPPSFSLSTSIISQVRIKTDRMAAQLTATNNRADFTAGPGSKTNIYLTGTGAGQFDEPGIIMPNVMNQSHVETNSSTVIAPEVKMKLHWHSYAMAVWLIVMVALSLWVAVKFRKLRSFHASKFSSTDLPRWFGPLLTQTAEKLHLRKIPEIALSETISSPAVFGVLAPVLVLPKRSTHRLSQKHTEHILLHELAHVKRGDLLVNTLYMLLQIVYWFNPLLWLLRRRLQHIRELCCDATVARILKEKTADYRETILEVTQRYLAGHVEPGLGLLGMTEDSSRLLVRLKWLQKKTWKYRSIRIATIFIVVTLMLVCVLPMAKAKNAGVLTVAADGSAKYISIQQAIDEADEGAVIRVGSGVYEENLTINKSVRLEGSGWDKTTIMTKNVGADVFEETMRTLNTRMQEAKTDEQRKEIASMLEAEFKEKYGKPTLLVSDTKGVVIRDLKLTSPGRPLKGSSMSVPIMAFNNAKAFVSKCVVIGSPGDGIHIMNGSDIEVRDSLVAAVWSTGIVVGESSGVRLLDGELRNCHYAGIRIRRGSDSTTVERCRISGAAWHGIRYDDCSPTIIGNRIFANARSGIYASGQTAATVRGNIFYANEMVGMSCWFQNRDTIEGNTFTGNKNAGLSVLGASKPIVKNNIFFSEPNAVLCGDIASDSSSAVFDGIDTLQKNLFWNNKHNAARRLAKTNSMEDIALDRQAGNLETDPMFANAARNDFSLITDSPARRQGIGAHEPIGVNSPWPLQPEEAAIIPDGQTRDYRQWKTPAKTTSSTRNFSVSGKSEVSPVNSSDIALLYHKDPDVRIKAIKKIAASNNSEIIDDLIRAHSVENYTPVHNEYGRALQSLTGNRSVRGKGAWKAWLDSEVQAGRLKIEYLSINPAADVQSEILVFALVGPDSFNEVAAILTAKIYDRRKYHDALRYMVFNDNLPEVQKFLCGDWLSSMFAHRDININDIGYFLNGLANPGLVRKRIDAQVHNCLESGNPVVVANALNLIAGVEGYSTRFIVPDVEKKVTGLTSSSVPQVAKLAQRALEKIKPGYTKAASSSAMSRESLFGVKDIPGELIFHGRYKHRSRGRDYGEPGELWLKQNQDGSITTVAHLPFMGTTKIASGDKLNRLIRYKDERQTSSASRSGYSIDLELLDGKVLLTRRGIRQDCDGKELKVPKGASFSPNARPDSYCAANILLRGFDLEEGQSKEFHVYDWDNSGEAMADYTIRVKHEGTESVDVPAGTFKAKHIVLTQVSSANTWFKKRAGHVTDFWVLDNGVIVRVLRHREPYEIMLFDYTTANELPGKSAVSEQVKAAPIAKSELQRLIDSAPAGQTVTIPKGVYTEPVKVTKPLILKGESRNECIFEVTSNQPAVSIDSKGKGKVLIEEVTIKWQLATSDRTEHPFAVAVKDTVAEIKNCCFEPLGNFKRCPVAINSMGFSELNIDTCRFEGFEYTVCFGQGTKGSIRNSLIIGSGHQGIMLYAGAKVTIIGNVVTGSRFHAVRSTGGTLNMTDNLIINNANRGVYLGNKSASGTIANNVIIGSGTSVGGFARSNVKVENNIIADSSYAGIGMRDSCRLSIRDNIFSGNERGLILFKDVGGNGNTVYKNTFWRNKADTENLDKAADSIAADPGFTDAENGDFSLKPGPALQHKQGLTNPEIFKKLWKIWKDRQNKNVPFTEN